MRTWWLFLIVLAVTGCTKRPSPTQNPAPAPTETGSVQTEASTPVAEAAGPEWATVFLKCEGLLGKSKDDVVAAIGPPTKTMDSLGQDRYDYEKPDEYAMYLDFVEKRLDTVSLFFPPADFRKEKARRVWTHLSIQDEPSHFLYSDEKFREDTLQPTGAAYDRQIVLITDLGPKRPIWVQGATKVPFLVGEKKFSTTTGRYSLGPLSVNPASYWGDVLVQGVLCGKHPEKRAYRLHDKHAFPERVEED